MLGRKEKRNAGWFKANWQEKELAVEAKRKVRLPITHAKRPGTHFGRLAGSASRQPNAVPMTIGSTSVG